MDFPQRLKELRKARGLTQQQIADLFGIKINTYQAWEEDRSKPRPVMLITIAKFYGITAEDLMFSKSAKPGYFGLVERYQIAPPNVRKAIDLLLTTP